MTVKKAKPTKKSAKKKATKKKPVKKPASRKRSTKKAAPRPYVEPKTAAELGIVCGAQVGEGKCGKPVIWFDYALGEKSHRAGFVCDEHRISNRVEKLAVKQSAKMTA